MDFQFNQQHHAELMREAEQRHLANIAMADSPQTSSTLQALLNRAGRSLVTVGERLQGQSAEMNPAFKQN